MVAQIVGISLVRNEDIFITQAITNVADFCDKIIILDNLSTDNTWREIEALKTTFPNVEAYQINDYRQSHNYISDYVGTNTWILGVDGDEIYDPKGLSQLRKDIFSGKFDELGQFFSLSFLQNGNDWYIGLTPRGELAKVIQNIQLSGSVPARVKILSIKEVNGDFTKIKFYDTAYSTKSLTESEQKLFQ